MRRTMVAAGLGGVAALLVSSLAGVASAAPATGYGPSVTAVAVLYAPARGTVAVGLTGPAGTVEVDLSRSGGHVSVMMMAQSDSSGEGTGTLLGSGKVGDAFRVEMVSDRPSRSARDTMRWLGAKATDLRTHDSIGLQSAALRGLPKLQAASKVDETSTTEVRYEGGSTSFDGSTLLANLADTRYRPPSGSAWSYYLASVLAKAGPTLELRNIDHRSGVKCSFRSIDPKRGDALDVTLVSAPRGAGTHLLVKDLRNGKSVAVAVP